MRFVLALLLSLNLNIFATEDKINSQNETEEIWEKWDSPEGISRLQKSDSKVNFWKLIRYYESQIRPTYCSVATSVIALNALSVEAPKSKFLGKYRMFTQEEFFSDDVLNIMDQTEVEKRGMSLKDLEMVLKVFAVHVSAYEGQTLSHDEIRNVIVNALKNPNQSVLALYQRRDLNQEGGGHWSPIAAYESESDSFLILDVARFKYPPVWINASQFINAMQTANMYDQSRGFIIIEKTTANCESY